MELYYAVHIALFISTLFECSSLKNKQRIMILWCIFFILFGGLRWEIGGDWDQYYEHFQNSSWDNIFNYDRYGNGAETLESGFVFINALVKSLLSHFWWYNILLLSFIQYTYYRFSNEFAPKHPLLMYTFIMIICSNYFPVRAGLSVAICFWAYRFIRKQHLRGFLFVVAAATLIHNQSIILLPFFWARRFKFSFWIYSVIYICIIIFSVIFQKYFILLTMVIGGDIAEKAYSYTQFETVGAKEASYMGWALNYFFLCIYIYVRKAMKLRNDDWYNCLLNIFIVYNAVFIIFSSGMGDLTRLSLIFVPAQFILFIHAVCYFVYSRKCSLLLSIIASIFYILYYIYKLTGIGDGYFFEMTCIPYKTIFDYGYQLF